MTAATTMTFGRDADCHVCPAIQALARRYRATSACRCGQRWTGDHTQAKNGTLLAPMDACETCNEIAADLEPGESIDCPSCGSPLSRPLVEGQRARRRRNNLSPRLRILRDCALIALWDSTANPKAIGVPAGGADTRDAPCETSEAVHVRGTTVSARADRTDRPDWTPEKRAAIMRGARLRAKLDRLRSRGASETEAMRAAWRLEREPAWLKACETARKLHDAPPPRPTPGDDVTSPVHRAAAVMEWLVPRARVFLDSVVDGARSPVHRHVPREIGNAFATATQRERWHPSPPAPPIAPANRPTPVLPNAPTEPPREHGWIARRRYLETELPAYLVLVETFAARIEAHRRSVERYPDDLRAYQAAVSAHKVARDGGDIGAQLHGDGLLDLVERVWGAR